MVVGEERERFERELERSLFSSVGFSRNFHFMIACVIGKDREIMFLEIGKGTRKEAGNER